MATSGGEWHSSGPEVVFPGIHRIPLPLPNDGLRAVNVFAVEDGDRVVLIDTGASSEASQTALRLGLESFGATLTDIAMVLATHGHYDHYGQAAHIHTVSGARLVLGEHERKLVDTLLEPDLYERSVRHRGDWLAQHGAGTVFREVEALKGQRTAGDLRWRAPDRWLSSGETLTLNNWEFRVQWTPGHTRGHIVYEEPGHRLLFAGDHVLPHITPSLGYEPFPDGLALTEFLSSLTQVRDLPVDLVLPGHGPAFDDLSGRVDELLAHHRDRLRACITVLSDGDARCAGAVADGLSWTRRDRAFSDLDAFNRMLAVTETVAHLEALVRDGRIERHVDDSHLMYRRAA